MKRKLQNEPLNVFGRNTHENAVLVSWRRPLSNEASIGHALQPASWRCARAQWCAEGLRNRVSRRKAYFSRCTEQVVMDYFTEREHYESVARSLPVAWTTNVKAPCTYEVVLSFVLCAAVFFSCVELCPFRNWPCFLPP